MTTTDQRDGTGEDIRAAEFAGPTAMVSGTSPPLIDLRKLWAMLWRNKWIIIAAGLLSIAAGIAATLLTTPRYDSFASVQIDQQATRVLEASAADEGSTVQDADRFLRTQIDVLNSRALAVRVAERERLFNGPLFFAAMHVPEPTDAPASGQARREAVIALLRANLGVDLPRDSRIVTIRFRSADRVFSARIANAFADAFIAANLERKIGSTGSARDLLSAQLARTKQQLADSERRLNGYARSANLIDTSAATGPGAGTVARTSITTASLVALNDAYSTAQAERIEREGTWRTAQATPTGQMGEVLGNDTIQSLLEQRAIKVATLAQERQGRTDAYPRVARAKAELAELDRQIAGISTSIRRSVQDRYLAALGKETELRAQVQRLKLETLSEQDRSVQYGILRREVETQRALYEAILQRFNELSAASNAAANNLSLVDRADPALSPSKPNPLLNLALALILGGIFAGGIILLREMLDDSLHSPADAERAVGLRVLATIPVQPRRNLAADINDPFSPAAESYASLLVPLGMLTPGGLPRSICVTSSQSAEGKTTTAYAVAVGLARRGRRVLLVDGDLRRPALARYAATTATTGLSDVLVGRVSLAEAVAPTDTPELSILQAGPLPANPSEVLGSGSLSAILAEATANFDCIVVDAPPLLGLADALSIATATEVTLFVIEAGRTSLSRARNAVRRLRDAQVRVAGGVITKFNVSRAGLAHEYGQGYFSYTKG